MVAAAGYQSDAFSQLVAPAAAMANSASEPAAVMPTAAQAAPQYPATTAARGPIRSIYPPISGLSRAGGAAQQTMVRATGTGWH